MTKVKKNSRLLTNFALFIVLFVLAMFDVGAVDTVPTVETHLLVTGRIDGDAADKRMSEFVSAEKRARLVRLSRYDLYKAFIDDLGVTRIAAYFHKENPSCHGVAHALGIVIGERVPELATGMQICGDTCTYACVHGVFKVYFERLGREYHTHSDAEHHQMQHATAKQGGVNSRNAMAKHSPAHKTHDHHAAKNTKLTKRPGLTQGELAKFGRDVREACDQSSKVVEDFFPGNCAHGVGHAMGMLAPSVAKATSYCRVFDSTTMHYYCETGVFMELGSKIKRHIFEKGMSRQQRTQAAVDYCIDNSDTPSACIRFMLPRNKNMEQVKLFAKVCAGKKGLKRIGCFNALGFNTRAYVANHPSDFQEACSAGSEQDSLACISGVAYMKKGQRYRSTIVQACNNLSQPDWNAACVEQSNKYYYQIDNNLVEALFSDSSK